MTAIQTGSFSFELKNMTFLVERQNLEIFPGYNNELVSIDYAVFQPESEAGVCLQKYRRFVIK